MLNIDKPEYQRLAALILAYREKGWGWAESQRMALAKLGWRVK